MIRRRRPSRPGAVPAADGARPSSWLNAGGRPFVPNTARVGFAHGRIGLGLLDDDRRRQSRQVNEVPKSSAAAGWDLVSATTSPWAATDNGPDGDVTDHLSYAMFFRHENSA